MKRFGILLLSALVSLVVSVAHAALTWPAALANEPGAGFAPIESSLLFTSVLARAGRFFAAVFDEPELRSEILFEFSQRSAVLHGSLAGLLLAIHVPNLFLTGPALATLVGLACGLVLLYAATRDWRTARAVRADSMPAA